MAFSLRGASLVVFAFCLFGCEKSPQPPKNRFDDLTLGMSFDGATKLVGKEGKPYDHEQLPQIPKPRQIFKSIPESTKWFVWWDEKTGIAVLTLGVLEGRVIYKGVMWDEDGKRTGAWKTLPEYQISK